MALYVSDDDVDRVLDLASLAPVVEDALVKQAKGAVERPERPHYPVGAGLDSAGSPGTALVMPAYVHGSAYFGTKLASLHEENPARGLPTLHAQLVLCDAATGRAVAFMDATRLTNARTGCVGGLAVRELTSGPVRLGVVGAGTQARWQTRAIAELTSVESVTVFSPSDSKHDCAAALRRDGLDASAVESARDAVRDATVVVTATTSPEPVFPADALSAGTVVVGVGSYDAGMQELEPQVFERASRVYADVPEEAAATGDVAATDLTVEDLLPLASLFDGGHDRTDDELVVVESVGSAVFDVAAAAAVYEAIRETAGGTALPD